MNVINNIGFIIIAGAGGYFAIKGYVSIGVISAFIVYAKQFGRPIDELANIWGQIQTAIAGAERVFAVLDEPSEDKSGEFTMDNSTGNIEFNHVDFSYIQGKQVLHDFNLKVKAGQKVALVGSTGSGKTTVVNLLMRFYDIDNGSITIDGVNIKDIDCENLRKNTAIVLQDTVLFADTVKNNLLYSRQDATDTEIIAAAKKANCHNMIMHLPDGYDSMLAKDGQNLSQGQRQLLSIARAFVASPKILILDEPTAGLDPKERISIRNYIAELSKDKIILFATHVVSDIECIADKVLLLKSGEIIATGTPVELIESMAGKVGEITCTLDEVGELQKEYKIGNIRQRKNGLALRVVGDELPEEAVKVGDNVEEIADGAFTNCDNLKYVILGKNVKKFNDNNVGGKKLEALELNDGTDLP